MATSLIGFKEKNFWMHNAVAEVWFATFMQKIKSIDQHEDWLISLSGEISDALSFNWIDGIVMTVFDSYLIDDRRLTLFSLILDATNKCLVDKSQQATVVSIGKFSANKEFLVPELKMLSDLFFRPDCVPSPPHIFILGKGWCLA